MFLKSSSQINKQYDVIVIGAGPAGFLASFECAKNNLSVLLVEKMDRPGKKLLITGGGRCNLTNASSIENHFENIYEKPKFLKHAYYKFFYKDIIELIGSLGVKTSIEAGNKVFPKDGDAKDVLDAFLKLTEKYNVEIITNTVAEKMLINDNKITGISIKSKNNVNVDVEAKKVILATGGITYPSTGSTGDGHRLAASAGHTIQKTHAALVPLVPKDMSVKKLQGLNLQNISIALWLDGKKEIVEKGDMIFTHFGFSGPAVLSISRFVTKALESVNKVELKIDYIPDQSFENLNEILIEKISEFSKRKISNLMKFILPESLIPFLLEKSFVDMQKSANQISKKERNLILKNIKEMPFEIASHRGVKEAMITAGGVSLKEIDSKTMQSKIIKGLYFAGEIINLDARTGGYNLQIAFSTAHLAAEDCTDRSGK